MDNYIVDTLGQNDINKILDIYNSNKIFLENPLIFWEKQGFKPSEKIQLEWNGYKSKAIKMYKTIQ